MWPHFEHFGADRGEVQVELAALWPGSRKDGSRRRHVAQASSSGNHRSRAHIPRFASATFTTVMTRSLPLSRSCSVRCSLQSRAAPVAPCSKDRTTIGAALVDTATEVASGVGIAATGTILAALFTGDIAASRWSAEQTAEFREAVTIAGLALTGVAAALVGRGIVRTRHLANGQATTSVDDAVPEDA